MLICATCAVERDEPTPELCPICTDERQYVPEDGQKWLTLDGLAQEGQQTLLKENEPGLVGIKTEPKVGHRPDRSACGDTRGFAAVGSGRIRR